MSNPFSGTVPPASDIDLLTGRRSAFSALDTMLSQSKNIALTGVEGSGKSSVLETFFCHAKRLEMAEGSRKIVVFTPFLLHPARGEIYAHLVDRIVECSSVLAANGGREAVYAIRSKAVELYRAYGRPASVLSGLIDYLRGECHLKVVMVIDNFENFTSSTSVLPEHHDLFRALMPGMQFVVATNYDFSRISLTSVGVSSFFLQTFSGNEIHLPGFTLSETEQYLRRIDPNTPLTPKNIQALHMVSGGIPSLLRRGADAAYCQLERSGVLDPSLLYETYKATRDAMRKWCAFISESQVYALGWLLRRDERYYERNSEQVIQALADLTKRGLLLADVPAQGQFDFNSLLFRQFCQEAGNLTPTGSPERREDAFTLQVRDFEKGSADIKVTDENYHRLMDELSDAYGPSSRIHGREYAALGLDESVLAGFSGHVRELIDNGIRIGRILGMLNGDEPRITYGGDCSAYAFSFLKAYELHLKECFLPIIMRYDGEQLRRFFGMNEAKSIQKKNVSMWNIEGFIGVWAESLASLSAAAGLETHTPAWWRGLSDRLKINRLARNDGAHLQIDGRTAVEFINSLFRGGLMKQITVGATLNDALLMCSSGISGM